MRRGRLSTLAAFAALALLLGAPRALAQQCPKGQEINADTAGKCCWPGQAWSRSRSACIGIPTCPPGFTRQGESCQAEACPELQYKNDDTKDHCCWAGQVWSDARSRCVGVPQMCPAGRAVLGEDCAPTHCEPGQDRLKNGACCWPGQSWWAEGSSCVGTPNKCPAGTSARPEGCISTGWTAFDGSRPDGEGDAPPGQPATPSDLWTPPPLLDAFNAPPQVYSTAPVAIADPSATPQQPPLAPPEEPKGPKKGRTSLFLGLLLNDGFAGAFQIRASPRLFSVLADTSFKGTGVLLIEPWLFLGGEADRGVGWFRGGLGLNLGAGWEQTLGPIEATVRVGAFNGFTLRTIVDNTASALGFNYELKFVLGLTLGVPAGEGTKFIVGFDAHIGGVPLFLVGIGVTF